jgi:AcrR family transcriptional regulator
MKGKSNTRKKILDAASNVVLHHGPTGFTLDKVAKEAGVSKGGLLYHFPSKEDLLRGMVERMISDFESSVLDRIAHDPVEKGRFLRAYISETAVPPEAGSSQERRNRLQSALIAALAVDNRLLDPLRERYKMYHELIEKDGINPIDGTIIRLAADAMWLSALFDMPTLNEEMQEKVLEYLNKISYGKSEEDT